MPLATRKLAARTFLRAALASLVWQAPLRPAELVVPNDNRVAAGVLANGVLTLRLVARLGRWFPDGNAGPSLVMPMLPWLIRLEVMQRTGVSKTAPLPIKVEP